MGEIIKLLAELVNRIHDILAIIFGILGIQLSDKRLHFIIFGGFGIFMFIIVDWTFKKISKWSISAISFIYTFTFLTVLALNVEIEQKITGSGNMEFQDIVAGVLGFLAMFVIYVAIRIIIVLGIKIYKKYSKREIEN